jgi:dihydroflavonol-4-reductase
MRVFVTGGTGFLGAAICRALCKAGHQVIALVREGSPHQLLADLPLRLVPGDLEDEGRLLAQLEGAEALCHVAGAAGRFYRDPGEYERVNVQATSRLFSAARRAGVRRAVYTGTIAIPSGATSDYALSKYRGAYEARRQAGGRMEVIVVHPSGMIGAGDIRPTPLGRAVLELAQGKLPAVLGGGSGYIDVDDAARGHVAALERGEPWREYILSAEYLPTQELFTYLAGVLKVRTPRRIPDPVALGVAYLSEPLARVLRLNPLITRFSSEYLLIPREKVPDGDADRRALGLSYRPVREAFVEAIDWFRAHGYLS